MPKERVDGALQYMLRCFRKDQKGFAYRPGEGASQAMTGAALLSLYLLGADDRSEVPLASQYLLDTPITNETRFFYYATYYTTQAAFQSGGNTWNRIWRRTNQALLVEGEMKQNPDGSCPASRTAKEAGQTYSTSMAILTLSIPLRLLPTNQR